MSPSLTQIQLVKSIASMSDSSSSTGIQEKIAARVLRTLMPIAVLGISIALTAEFMIPEMRIAALTDLSIVAALLLVWYIVYKGRIRLAAHLLIVMLCLIILLGMTMYGGVHATIYVVSLIAVPLIVLLYGPLYSFLFATAFSLAGLLFLYLEGAGMLHEALVPPSWLVWLFISIDCYIIWLLTAVPDKMLHQALVENEQRRLDAEKSYQRESKALQDLKEREEDLRVALVKYKTLFESFPLGVTISDTEGTILESNTVAANLLGLPQEEFDTRSIDSDDWCILRKDGTSMPPDEYASVRALKENHPVENVEMGVRKPDGTRIWINVTAAPLPLEGYGVAVAFSDITDRKISEEALRTSEERFRSVFEISPTGIAIIDIENQKFVKTNPSFQNIVGYTEEDLSKLSISDITHPDDIAEEQKAIAEIIKQGLSEWSYEKRYVRKDGTARWVYLTGDFLKSNDGKILAIANIVDITERKQVIEALQKSEERYRDLVENSEDLICTHDLHGKIISANETAARASGYPMKQILGMNLIDALVPDARQHFQEYLDTIQNEGKNSGVMVIRTASGDIRYWEYNNTLRTLGVDVPIVRGMAHDITERVHAEEERERLEEELRQSHKMEAIGNLAGGVAHEFNNLLQIMLGGLEMVQMDISSSSEHSPTLKDIEEAGKRAADLTRQLLAFSRRQTLTPVNLDLNALIQEELSILKRLIEANIDLVFNPGADLGVVHADKRQLQTILMNLCVNARDAMPKGGILSITTANTELDEDYCNRHEQGNPGHYVRISVTDTGHGMNAEQRERIFEPFYTTKEMGKGTGLGLATVYGIVMQHHGMLDCYSEPGRGTAFNIYLPIAEGAVIEKPANTARIAGPGGMETILIADDEPLLLKLLAKMLTRAGYDVITAKDGEEAVQVFTERADEIDLVILDVIMPRCTGQEAMERIKKTHPDTSFMFSSGYSENAIQTDFVLKKGLQLISKPYNGLDLLRKVRAVLDA